MKTMTTLIAFLTSILLLSPNALADRTSPLIIDHTNTDINLIPDTAIENAKANLHIAYEHTSHGSQLITGMNALRAFPEFGSKFNWGNVADDSSILDLHDNAMPDGIDLSSGEYRWYDATREYLDNPVNADVNVIMWSWCNIASHDIDYYIGRMEALIAEYGNGSSSHPVPVHFVFMTGHANGGGEGDSSDARNQQIRAHCMANNRILFDFADIENYDPDNRYFLDKMVDDALYYDSDNNGSKDRNWASEYLAANPGSQLFQLVNGTTGYDGCGSCSHSPEGGETNDAKLNCVLKGCAVWWLWARLAGWGECTAPPTGVNAQLDAENRQIQLSWTHSAIDTDVDAFIVQRRVDDGPWVNDYQNVAGDTTTFTDANLEVGSYQYRVVAHLFDDGEGNPCNSTVSNTVTVQFENPDLPATPSALSAQVNSEDGTITLSWTDNADNETGYIIQRRMNDGVWEENYDQTGAGTSQYIDTNQDAGALDHGTYTYRVLAVNDSGQSMASNEASAQIGANDSDSDGDGVPDDQDGCPNDADKTEPGTCGCGQPETDSDNDNTPNCNDLCPDDPAKIEPGQCGCGVPETRPCDNVSPQLPALITPSDQATDVSLSPTLTASAFQDSDTGDTHGRTIWQIATGEDFIEMVYDETSDQNLTEISLSATLTPETTYYWRARYIDNRGAQSQWSEPFSFTTGSQDQTPDDTPDDDNSSDDDESSGCFLGAANR